MRNIWTTTGKCFLINYFVEVIQKFHLFYSNIWLLTLPLPKRPNCILNQKRGKILWNWNLTLRRNWMDGPFKSRVRISVDPFTSSQGAKCAPPPPKKKKVCSFAYVFNNCLLFSVWILSLVKISEKSGHICGSKVPACMGM